MHFQKSQHPIALNIKKVEKEISEDDKKKQQEITKLAIGKPGGVDAETDRYDTLVALKCLACNIELDRTAPHIASMVDSILLTESAYFASAV